MLCQSDPLLRFDPVKANPLLRYDLKRVRLVSFHTEDLRITMLIGGGKPVNLKFESQAEMDEAYREWTNVSSCEVRSNIIKIDFEAEKVSSFRFL